MGSETASFAFLLVLSLRVLCVGGGRADMRAHVCVALNTRAQIGSKVHNESLFPLPFRLHTGRDRVSHCRVDVCSWGGVELRFHRRRETDRECVELVVHCPYSHNHGGSMTPQMRSLCLDV